MIEAARIDLSIIDIPENEIFPVEEFGNFRIRLNNAWIGKIIDFTEWVKDHKDM